MTVPEDLTLTVRELSNTYEELSLLYRMSEVFSCLSIDDICSRIIAEASNTISVKTAAVLFLDDRGAQLVTKTSRGAWLPEHVIDRDDGIIWKCVESKRPSAFCSLAEAGHQKSFPELRSLMVCPLVGKAKIIGALVVADKESGEEFYSNDSKLLTAISAQAGLAIENAILYQELESLLLGAIRSLVKALEASSHWTAGHTERVTAYSVGIGKAMGLDADVVDKLKISALLHDIGKIATPKEILNKEGGLEAHEWIEIKRHPGMGAEILVELKQFKDVIQTVKYHHEHWDGGKGIYGLKQDEIPFMARILAVADAFDAMTSNRPYRSMMTKKAAVSEIVRCSGTQFDPKVVEAFISWVENVTPQHQAS